MNEVLMILLILLMGIGLGIVKIYINTRFYARDVYEKTFVCPNCGAKFKIHWYQIIYKRNSVYMYNAARLKCPVCHQKDMCSVAHDER